MKCMVTFMYGSSENNCIFNNSIEAYAFVEHLNNLDDCGVTAVCKLDYDYMTPISHKTND